jgi:hypothetical protein
MKARIAWFALVTATALACAPSHARAIALELVPEAMEVAQSQTFSIAARVSDLGEGTSPSLSAFDLNVTFSPMRFDFVSVAFGDPGIGDQLDLFGLGSLKSSTPGAGFLNLSEISLDAVADLNALQAGSFTLATLHFRSKRAGTGLFAFANVILGDAEGAPLSAAIVSTSSITVVGSGVVDEPGSMSLLLAALASMASMAWRGRRRGLGHFRPLPSSAALPRGGHIVAGT